MLSAKEVLCLHVPDDYEYMESSLIEELRAKLSPHFPEIQGAA
jgi:predicted protein tyrosine phosphatase